MSSRAEKHWQPQRNESWYFVAGSDHGAAGYLGQSGEQGRGLDEVLALAQGR